MLLGLHLFSLLFLCLQKQELCLLGQTLSQLQQGTWTSSSQCWSSARWRCARGGGQQLCAREAACVCLRTPVGARPPAHSHPRWVAALPRLRAPAYARPRLSCRAREPSTPGPREPPSHLPPPPSALGLYGEGPGVRKEMRKERAFG